MIYIGFIAGMAYAYAGCGYAAGQHYTRLRHYVTAAIAWPWFAVSDVAARQRKEASEK